MSANDCRTMRSERTSSVALEPFPEEGIGEAGIIRGSEIIDIVASDIVS